MGILKGIIDRFRAMGKTENEILSIVEAANEQFERCGKPQKHE